MIRQGAEPEKRHFVCFPPFLQKKMKGTGLERIMKCYEEEEEGEGGEEEERGEGEDNSKDLGTFSFTG